MGIKFYYFHTDFFVFFSNFSKKYKILNKHKVFKHMYNEIKDISNNKIIIPTYNYNFPKTKIFDYYNDISEVGAFSEYFRRKYKNNRTEIPIFSDTSNYNLNLITRAKNPFDKYSVFEYLKKNKGEVVNFGSNFAPTFIMYIEKNIKLGPIYRFEKEFDGVIKKKIKKKICIKFFCRPMTIKIEYDLKKIQRELLNEGILKIKKTDSKFSYNMFNCKEFYDFAIYKLKKNNFYFLTKNNGNFLKKIIQAKGRFDKNNVE